MQSDPIGFAAGDLNLYAYTWNDPGNWSDPSGLAVTTDWVVKTAQVVRLASRAVTGAALRAVVGAARAAAKDSIEGAALCLGSTAASVIGSYARNYAAGNRTIDEDAIQRVAECAAVVIPRPCGCGGGGRPGKRSSFPAGTEVLTPSGKVAIEDLREGDLVVTRHEITGEMGEFPVTALMARQAPSVIWLTLDDGAGESSPLGVTSEHPMFVVGKGWTEADQIVVGDAIRDAGLGVLKVIAIDVDNTPLRVHNLEVARAATYFVGDLEAWGHNDKLVPDPNATGSHSTFERDECGTIHKYQEWNKNPKCPTGFSPGTRYRGKGKASNGILPPLLVCKPGNRKVPAIGPRIPKKK